MNTIVRTKSPEQRTALLNWLFGKGFLWHGENKWNPQLVQSCFPWDRYPNLSVNINKKYTSGTYNDDGSINIITFCEKVEKVEKYCLSHITKVLW